jgi:PilZ domain
MSNNERRIVPRKSYSLPVRFNILPEEFAAVSVRETHAVAGNSRKSLETMPIPQVGESVNLSERGILFKTRHSVSIGDRVEMFFSLPTELTGRAMEDVKCSARVVHVDHQADASGQIGVGASIECFERTSVARSWAN